MDSSKIKLLYLAPEIPALSATFVYNEMLEMKSKGYSIEVASVHKPDEAVKDICSDLFDDVNYLYDKSTLYRINCFFSNLLKSPRLTVITIFMLLSDMLSLRVNRQSLGLVYRFFSACDLARQCERNNVEHIHVHFAHVPTDIAMYAAQMAGISYSVTSHANDIFERGYLLEKKISRSKFFGTISNFNKLYLEKYDIGNKLKIIYCGVVENKFSPRNEQPNNEVVKIGLLGRLVEKKGIHILIEALNLLKNKKIKFIVDIVGDGPELKRLERLVSQYGLDTKVIFKGKMRNDQVPDWLTSLDFFALPCVKDKNGDMDGIPVSLMEAMLRGVPVISTDISGLPELVLDGETGFVAKSGDVKDLSKTLERVHISPIEYRGKLAKNAIEHVRNKFSLSVNVSYISELISE